jgi:hypothetical protein
MGLHVVGSLIIFMCALIQIVIITSATSPTLSTVELGWWHHLSGGGVGKKVSEDDEKAVELRWWRQLS